MLDLNFISTLPQQSHKNIYRKLSLTKKIDVQVIDYQSVYYISSEL